MYGLVGEKLSHSFSKEIHEILADYCYTLLPMDRDELHAFLQEKKFNAINVTIPYKQEVIPYCDTIDAAAMQIGAVNTIVNRGGVLEGYNTDFAGFLYMLNKNKISLLGKKVAILGSGGTSKTVKAVAEFQKAAQILVVSRTKSDQVITYEELFKIGDVQVVINTTPLGMYPSNDSLSLDISNMKELVAVVDVIYNPLETRLLLKAKERGLAHANGLLMLVAQAKFAAEHFLGIKIDDNKIDQIYKELLCRLTNIVLVGMPGSGKTTIGEALSCRNNMPLIDTDMLVEQRAGMTIKEIFSKHGELYFRKIESEVIAECAKLTGQVISTGGGAILDPGNIQNLCQNGQIVFIDRPLEQLVLGDSRPLSTDIMAVKQLYKQRYQLYKDCSEVCILNDSTAEKAASGILSLLKRSN